MVAQKLPGFVPLCTPLQGCINETLEPGVGMLSNVLLVLCINELPPPNPALGFELVCVVPGQGWGVVGSTDEQMSCGLIVGHSSFISLSACLDLRA